MVGKHPLHHQLEFLSSNVSSILNLVNYCQHLKFIKYSYSLADVESISSTRVYSSVTIQFNIISFGLW